MPQPTQSMLMEEIAGLRRRVAELEEQLAAGPPAAAPAGLDLLHQVKNSTLDAVFAIDCEYRLLMNNSPHQQALLAGGGRALKPGESLLLPEYAAEVRSYWQAAYDRALRGETFRLETAWTDQQGQARVFENNFSPLLDASGVIVGALVVAHDISELKRSQEALRQADEALERRAAQLRESEKRFQRLFLSNSAPQVISTFVDGRMLDVNDAFCRLLGYRREELLGRTTVETGLWDATYRQALIEAMKRPGGPGEYEISVRTRSGEVRQVLLTCEPLELDGVPCLISSGLDITARKRAEQALAEMNAKLEKILEVLPVGISILDAEGQVVKENPMLAKVLGLSVEGLQRGDYRKRQYIHGDGRPFPVDDFPSRRVLCGEESIQDVEIGVIKEDGKTLWTQVSAAAVPFSDWQAVIVTSDITARKQAEETLRASEHKFATIFEHSPLAIGISRLADNRFADVNPAMCRLFGFTREEMLGSTSAQLGLWVDPSERQRMLDLLKEGGYVYGFEAVNRSKSGELLDILISAQIVEIGQEKYLLGQIADISQSKRAQAALVESEKRFRTIAETAGEGVVIAQPTGEFFFVNQRMADLLGYRVEEILGRTGMDFVFEPWRRQVFENRARLGSAHNVQGEFKFRRKDGSALWTSYHATAMFNEQGRYIANFAMHTDITERKRVQEELEQSHAQLQALSRRLLEAQENERRAIGRELHDEIGQTLTGLSILLEIAQRPPLQDNQSRIKQAQQVAKELIDRVSTLSLDLRPSILDDMGLVPALLWQIDRYSAQTNVQVNFGHSGLQGRRFAAVIETAVYRLVQEALTNVARHARVKQASVRVDASSSAVEIFVADEGVGFVPGDVLDTKDAGGLDGMRERARLLEGELEIDSAPGQGARISIRLPLANRAGQA